MFFTPSGAGKITEVKSNPVAISPAVKTCVLGAAKAAPLTRSSRTSPTAAPVAPNPPTFTVKLLFSNALISGPSTAVGVEGAVGAVASKVRTNGTALGAPTFPIWSVTRAVIFFVPSGPGSVTFVKVNPEVTWPPVSTCVRGAAKGEPFTRISRISPATAPVPPRPLR